MLLKMALSILEHHGSLRECGGPGGFGAGPSHRA
jgi:hypothetical protein